MLPEPPIDGRRNPSVFYFLPNADDLRPRITNHKRGSGGHGIERSLLLRCPYEGQILGGVLPIARGEVGTGNLGHEYPIQCPGQLTCQGGLAR